MKRTIVLTSLFLSLFVPMLFAAEIDFAQHKNGIWSIPGTAESNRWIIIHNLPEATSTGIYHIEVIGREVNAPAWEIKHLVEHMAITRSALAASVLEPLAKGDVYPETFDDALQKWQQQNSGKGGPICTTTVIDCMGD